MLKFLLVTETFLTSDISHMMNFTNESHFSFESHHNAAAQIKPSVSGTSFIQLKSGKWQYVRMIWVWVVGIN